MSGSKSTIPASPSSAQWSKRETAQLVRAWHDVVNDAPTVQETVDAFQTRLLHRFKEVGELEGDADGGVRVVRTLTSVALKTYALRRMARFIAEFMQQQNKRESEDGCGGGDDDEEMAGNWFSFSKSEQIERFQEAGATNFIELDEDTYYMIERVLEKQARAKQHTPTPVCSAHHAAWSGDEMGYVVQAWRDVFKEHPATLPHTSAIYARFIALNGDNAQRTKPEMASKKLALMNMYTVIAGFNNESTSCEKITRGSMKRQRRQNWFSLSPSEREHVFAEAVANRKEYHFLDIDEEMYGALGKLMRATEKIQEASKRRTLKKRRSTDLLLISSNNSEPIDLVSDNDDDDSGDDDTASGMMSPSLSSQEASQSQYEYSPKDENGNHKSDVSVDLEEEEEKHVLDEQPHTQVRTNSETLSENQTMSTSSSEDEHGDCSEFDDSTTIESSSSMETANDSECKSDCELERVSATNSAHKKQKVDTEVLAMVNMLEKQTEHLSDLVHQVQAERARDQQEREKVLQAIAQDQKERQRVLEQLKTEQEERRVDRDERRQILQLLMREQEERRRNEQEGTTFKKEMKSE